MADFLTDVGEEWVAENNLDGATVIVTFFNQDTDALTEADNLSSITTEPGGASYSRLSTTVTTAVIGSSFGPESDNTLTFDVSDSSPTINHGAIIVNFQSDTVAGDGSPQDNLVGVGDLGQDYDLSQLDELEVAAQDLQIPID